VAPQVQSAGLNVKSMGIGDHWLSSLSFSDVNVFYQLAERVWQYSLYSVGTKTLFEPSLRLLGAVEGKAHEGVSRFSLIFLVFPCHL